MEVRIDDFREFCKSEIDRMLSDGSVSEQDWLLLQDGHITEGNENLATKIFIHSILTGQLEKARRVHPDWVEALARMESGGSK